MHQWVALACCLDPDKGHLLTDACPERGLLQVWALGALNLRSAGCDPKLALALGHDFGFVADLCWCPSGCWEDRLPDHATGARRLGLLALACGDGSVRILSIPVPEDLDCPEGRRPLFGGGGCWATLKLFPGQLGISPCLRVAWEPSNEHRLLAAAYADGRAAVFDLAGKGPLAHGLGEPLWVVQAHSAAVTGLAWAAGTLARHLCTASIDQEAKVWPFERPGTVPTSCFRRGPVRSLAVSPHWNGMFLTGEESFIRSPSLSVYKENGYYGHQPKSLAAHMSTSWCVTVSPWTNAAASCDVAGELGAIVLQFLAHNPDTFKHHTRGRLPVYRVSMVSLKEDDKVEVQRPKKPPRRIRKSSCGPCTLVSSHDAALAEYGLNFQDASLANMHQLPSKEVDKVCRFIGIGVCEPNQYHLNSLNTVSWSPNWSSCGWLLSAGQAGLARISWVGLLARGASSTEGAS